MAARLEQERFKSRKARLIKQNEAYRRDLQDQAEDLREMTQWMERGYVFFKAADRLRNWTSLLRPGKQRGFFSKLWRR